MMALELCKLCDSQTTPWYYTKSLQGHICQDCYHQAHDVEEAIRNKVDLKKLLEFIKKNARLHETQENLQEQFDNPAWDEIGACRASEALRSREILKQIGEFHECE